MTTKTVTVMLIGDRASGKTLLRNFIKKHLTDLAIVPIHEHEAGTTEQFAVEVTDEMRAALSMPFGKQTKPSAVVTLNSETGGDPVNSHGGLAQAVYWTLHVNGELIFSDSARFKWDTDINARLGRTQIKHAPGTIRELYNSLSAALDPPPERNEHAGDALAYAMSGMNLERRLPHMGDAAEAKFKSLENLTTFTDDEIKAELAAHEEQRFNFREPGEFGEGATVKVELPVDATKPDLATLVITGKLRRAIRGPYFGDDDVLTGNVYGHKVFPDGAEIHTSPIVENLGPDLFRTKSGSIYKVEYWAAKRPE